MYYFIVIDHAEDIRSLTAMPTSSKSIFVIANTSYQSTSTMLKSSKPVIISRTSTSDCQSTSIVTITTTVKVNMSPTSVIIVQQSQISSDSNDSCNITAIVVPTALLIIALIVIVCVNIVVVKMVVLKRRKGEDLIITSINDHTTCVVENDLYQLVTVTYTLTIW